jgi:hypothetical protein
MDGDAKINLQEFEYGMRSSLISASGKPTHKQLFFKNKQRSASSTGIKTKRSLSRELPLNQ